MQQRMQCARVRSAACRHRAVSQIRCAAEEGARYTKNRAAILRDLLKGPTILQGPCCHDGISAKLIEDAGFPYAFMSGFCTSAARLGAPDTGLMSYYEMVDQGRYVNEATKHLPIIGDGDTGYGNAVNVKRTVRGYAQAGFAGILIEDQVSPKSCGHVRGKKVVGREEAVARIRAACDARDEGADIIILARTDARQAESLDEALWRAQAFADAGADVLFIDALESVEELRAFCAIAPGVPKMANMLEGGGKTPLLSPQELQDLGFKLVAYPLSLLAVSVRAMEYALQGLKRGELPSPAVMGTFASLQESVGFPEYYNEEERYAVSSPGFQAAAPVAPEPEPQPSDRLPFVEAEVIEPPAPSYSSSSSSSSASSAYTSSSSTSAVILQSSSSSSDDGNWRRKRFLRVVIRDFASQVVTLETRIPAGFLQGIAALVPQVSGMNIEGLVEQAMGKGAQDSSTPIFSLNSGNEIIQIYLE